MKNKQRMKFHNAIIYNSDDDGFSWMDDIDSKPQNGQEMVFARSVAEAAIAACDADLSNHVAPHAAAT